MKSLRLTGRLITATGIVVLLVAILVACSLPSYTCKSGYQLVDYSHLPGGGPACVNSVTGYWPRSWLPTKLTVLLGGHVVSSVILPLLPRRRLAAIGVLIAFAALAAPWFIQDGFEQTMRDGSPVCCGRVIDREWVRTSIPLVGTTLGVSLIVVDIRRARRSRQRERVGEGGVEPPRPVKDTGT
jgi:hypothetical protein